jgi:retron-type reverse transcriptase
MHHFNVESLRVCFQELKGNKAIGSDGVSKEMYGANLDENLSRVVQQLKTMSYRPAPVRQILIPKEGQTVAVRPLGISNFEDKLIQKMSQKLLESIYEPLFLDSSFGFRPRKSCHDAIQALGTHMKSTLLLTLT